MRNRVTLGRVDIVSIRCFEIKGFCEHFKGKIEVYVAFVDLKKVYDLIDWNTL